LIPKHADHRDLITGYTHEVKGDEARLLAHQGHKALLDVPGDLRLRARGNLGASYTEGHGWRWYLRTRLLDESGEVNGHAPDSHCACPDYRTPS
jgi:hypothetical protein